jgi:amino acid adenylation domain-containing protein
MSEAVVLPEAKRILIEKYLAQKARKVSAEAEPIPRRPPNIPIPLSFWQQLLWLHSQMVSDVPVYNEPITVHRTGPLDVEILEKTLTEIFRRHEAWRTTFVVVDGQPAQVIQPPPVVKLPVTDLRSLPESEREVEARRLAAQDARIPIDLEKGPLLRFRLIRLSELEHRLFVILHHFVFDGWSIYQVFLRELIALYESFANGQPSPLPELLVQYADYAYWQQQTAQQGQFSDQIAYWRQQLRDLPVLELPGDRPRPAVESHRGSMHPVELPANLSSALRDFSQEHGVTFFMTLLAGFVTMLHRYTGQQDMVIGTVTAGRNRPELEKMLGLFLNPLVLRTNLAGNPSFSELLLRVRDVTLTALTHSEVPFHYVVEQLKPKRDPSYNPLFQAMIAREPPITGLRPGWNMTQADTENGGSKMDLYLDLDDRPTGVIGRLTYNTDIFERPTITRLLQHWQTILEGALANPNRRLSQMPILTDAERRQASAFCRTIPPAEGFARFTKDETRQSIPSRFEKITAKYGNRTAIQVADRGWTYNELHHFSNRIAAALIRDLGTDQQRVALFVGHGAPMIAAMLGVLKAGKIYVPVDPLYPPERIAYILADCQAVALLTDSANRARASSVAKTNLSVICIEDINADDSDQNATIDIRPDALAYILYTSGSTGRPKGVMQSHGNVLTFIKNYTNAFAVSPADRLSLIPSYGFDAAVIDIYGGLLNGACLYPFDVRQEAISKLGEWLSAHRISIYHSTPTVYRHFMDTLAQSDQLPDMRLVILGGEPVQKNDFEVFSAHFPADCLFANLSGQTESSLNMVNTLDTRAVLTRQSVSMGHPVENTEVLLLDDAGQPTELYGEIAIQSEHLALGYWNQPETTRAVFFADPDGGNRRVYRSGDMARMMPDGTLEFVQRKDSQIKLHGFRIELGEVEAVLSQHSRVKESAAVIREINPGDKCLVAYWVPKEQRTECDTTELREFAKQKLPNYMVPSFFVRLDMLPQTTSGKVDRRALPCPSEEHREKALFVAPRNELEHQLAEIWERVMEVAHIGVEDDFFALGGHSLMAVRLFDAIAHATGQRLPLSTLFEAPTIAQMTRLLSERWRPAVASALVPLHTRGSLPPLFAIHGHSGEILFYHPLSQRLGAERPFYALQARGRDGVPAHDTVVGMASEYIEEILKVHAGPYCIAGFCFGALVAYEMAQQLLARGKQVGFLGLFISYAPEQNFIDRIQIRIDGHLKQLRQMGPKAKLELATSNLVTKAQSMLWRTAYQMFRHRLAPSSRLFQNVPEMNLQAAKKYSPKPYSGEMTVFLSGPVPPGFQLDPHLHLDGMHAAGIHLRVVPGDRHSMFQEPHVAVLAEELKKCLRESGHPKPELIASSDRVAGAS